MGQAKYFKFDQHYTSIEAYGPILPIKILFYEAQTQ